MEGDRVSALLGVRRAKGGLPEARVARILSRSERPVVGIVSGGSILPIGGLLASVALPKGSYYQDGQVVAAKLGAGEGPPRASEVSLLGGLDDPQTPIRAAEIRYGLSKTHPENAEAEAMTFGQEVKAAEIEGRTDFRDLPTVTVDPADAKDFDDAVSIRREAGGFRLWVHIADVSHYVAQGSEIDGEAAARGNTTYLPGLAYPMLPETLSGHLCSLKEGLDRLTFSVEMRLDGAGKIVCPAVFHRGVIRSIKRLSYEEAQSVLDGGWEAPKEVADLLKDSLALSKLLFQRRLKKGTLDLDLPEADLRFGLTGHIEEVLPTVRLDSHRIIEEFMILANTVVAERLAGEGVPSLYRVHEEPSPEKLEELRPLLNSLGLGEASRGDLSDPFVLQKVLEKAAGHRAEKLVSYLVLRAMMQARYSDGPLGHYGLAIERYCHFTSPIRRYPDLVVHRSLGALMEGGNPGAGDLSALAAHCSQTERVADQAEREVVSWYQMAFLAGRMGDVFDSIVLGFSRFGVRIELVDHLIEGHCPFHAMRDDHFIVERDGLSIKGRYTGAKLKVGDQVQARLIRVDRLVGEAHFVPEDWPFKARTKAESLSGDRSHSNKYL